MPFYSQQALRPASSAAHRCPANKGACFRFIACCVKPDCTTQRRLQGDFLHLACVQINWLIVTINFLGDLLLFCERYFPDLDDNREAAWSSFSRPWYKSRQRDLVLYDSRYENNDRKRPDCSESIPNDKNPDAFERLVPWPKKQDCTDKTKTQTP